MKIGQNEEIKIMLENTYSCSSEVCVYHDTYFDTTNDHLKKRERELRLRKIVAGDSETILLTFKEPPFESTSKSKREHEVQVNSYEQTANTLRGLGYVEDISFQKHCINLRVLYRSLDILVTLVRILELKHDFIEVEVPGADLDQADQIYQCLYEFLFSLQIIPEQLTNVYYTEMVRQARI